MKPNPIPRTASLSLAPFLAMTVGCVSPTVKLAPTSLTSNVTSAPHETPGPVTQEKTSTRVVAIQMEKAFPKILDVLMSHDIQIRSANKELGHLSIHQQWRGKAGLRGELNHFLEGTLLIQPADQDHVRIRLSLHGSLAGTTSDFTWNVYPVAPETYTQILDLLEKGLISHPL